MGVRLEGWGREGTDMMVTESVCEFRHSNSTPSRDNNDHSCSDPCLIVKFCKCILQMS